jgi:hypothetical protein
MRQIGHSRFPITYSFPPKRVCVHSFSRSRRSHDTLPLNRREDRSYEPDMGGQGPGVHWGRPTRRVPCDIPRRRLAPTHRGMSLFGLRGGVLRFMGNEDEGMGLNASTSTLQAWAYGRWTMTGWRVIVRRVNLVRLEPLH